MTNRLLKIGCCDFPLTKYKYCAHFSTVEAQQTFYQPPRISTLERWRSLMPPDFEFTLKAWQLITHASRSPTYRRLKIKLAPEELEECGAFQTTSVVLDAWKTTRACAEALGARLVLFQCPASFKPESQNIEQMRHFFATIDRGGLKFLWEPRGDWPSDLILTLCKELQLVHAVDPFVSRSVTTDFVYFRLHGGKGFKHIYSDSELQALLEMLPGDNPCYVMFNNIAMLDDANRFKRLVNAVA